MTDTTAATAVPTVPGPAQGQEGEAAKPETDWQAEARKWEARAKENKSAAARLSEIEEASKSEAEKAAERLTKAEQRAAEAEARALRREVALDHRLSKDDAGLLDGMTDEDAMRRLAERLSQQEADRTKNGNRVPREGANPSAPEDKSRTVVRDLFGG